MKKHIFFLMAFVMILLSSGLKAQNGTDTTCAYDPSPAAPATSGQRSYSYFGSLPVGAVSQEWSISPSTAGEIVGSSTLTTVTVRWFTSGSVTCTVYAAPTYVDPSPVPGDEYYVENPITSQTTNVTVIDLPTFQFMTGTQTSLTSHTWMLNLCNMGTSYFPIPFQVTGRPDWRIGYTVIAPDGTTRNITLENVHQTNWVLDTVPAGNSGTYKYIVTYITDNTMRGCTKQYQDTLIVNRNLSPAVAWVDTKDTCFGAQIPVKVKLLRGTYNDLFAPQGKMTYTSTYLTPGPTPTNQTLDIPTDKVAGDTLLLGYVPADQPYTVTLLNIQDNYCDSNINMPRIFSPRELPVPASLSIDQTSICERSYANLTVSIKDPSITRPGFIASQGPWKVIVVRRNSLNTLIPPVDTVMIPVGSMSATKSILVDSVFTGGMLFKDSIKYSILDIIDASGCHASADSITAFLNKSVKIEVKRTPKIFMQNLTSIQDCDSAQNIISLIYDYPDSVIIKLAIKEGTKPVDTVTLRWQNINGAPPLSPISFNSYTDVWRKATTTYSVVSASGVESGACVRTSGFFNAVQTDTILPSPSVKFAMDTMVFCGNDTTNVLKNRIVMQRTGDSTRALRVVYSTWNATTGVQVGTPRGINYPANWKRDTILNTQTNIFPPMNSGYLIRIDTVRYTNFTGDVSPIPPGGCPSYDTDTLLLERIRQYDSIYYTGGNYCANEVDSATLSLTVRNSVLPLTVTYRTQTSGSVNYLDTITIPVGAAGLTAKMGTNIVSGTVTFKVKLPTPSQAAGGNDTVYYSLTSVTSPVIGGTCGSDSLRGTAKVVVHKIPTVRFQDGNKFYICNQDSTAFNIKLNFTGTAPYTIIYNSVAEFNKSVFIPDSTMAVPFKMPLTRDSMLVSIVYVEDAYCHDSLISHQREVTAMIYRLPPLQPTIRVRSINDVAVTGIDPTKACEGDKVVYETNMPGLASYNWTFSGNGSVQGYNNTDSLVVLYTPLMADGVGRIDLGVSSATGNVICVNRDSINLDVNVYDKPEATLTNLDPTNVCEDEEIRLSIHTSHESGNMQRPYVAYLQEGDLGVTAISFYGTDTVITRTLTDSIIYTLLSIHDSRTYVCEKVLMDSVTINMLPDPQFVNIENFYDGKWFTCETQYNDTIKMQIVGNCRINDKGYLRLQVGKDAVQLFDNGLVGPSPADPNPSISQIYVSGTGNGWRKLIAQQFEQEEIAPGDTASVYYYRLSPTNPFTFADTMNVRIVLTSNSPVDTSVAFQLSLVDSTRTELWSRDGIITRTVNLTTTDAPEITSTFNENVVKYNNPVAGLDYNVVSGCDTTYFAYTYTANCKRGVDGYLRFGVMNNLKRDSLDFFYMRNGEYRKIEIPANRTYAYIPVEGNENYAGGTIEMAVISKATTRHELSGMNRVFGLYFDQDSNIFGNNSFAFCQDTIDVITPTNDPIIAFTNASGVITDAVITLCEVEDFGVTAFPGCREGRDVKINVQVANNTEAGNYNDFILYYYEGGYPDSNGNPAFGDMVRIQLDAEGKATIKGTSKLVYPHVVGQFGIENISNATRQQVAQNLTLTASIVNAADVTKEWAAASLNATIVPVAIPYVQDTVATCRVDNFNVIPRVDNYVNDDYRNNSYYNLTPEDISRGFSAVVWLDRNGDNVSLEMNDQRPTNTRQGLLIHPTQIMTGQPLNQTGFVPFSVFKAVIDQFGNICAASDTVDLVIAINPVPSVVSVPHNPIYRNGEVVADFYFSGTTDLEDGITRYEWERISGDDLGLNNEETGTNFIPGFTAKNNGTKTLVAEYKVTPFYSYKNGSNCPGEPKFFKMSVIPEVGVVEVQDQVVCSKSTMNVEFYTNAATKISWKKVSGDNINGLSNGQLSDVQIQNGQYMWTSTPINKDVKTLTATYRVVAELNIGTGSNVMDSTDFTITVRPEITIQGVANKSYCANSATSEVAFKTNLNDSEPVKYAWRFVSGDDIGSLMGASDVENFASFTTTEAGTATYAVKAYYPGTVCESAETFFTYTVKASNVLIAPVVAPAAVCEGSKITPVAPTVTPAGSYTTKWILGTDDFNPNVPVAYADNNKLLYYSVETSCGTTLSEGVAITVNAKPLVGTITAPAAVCAGTTIAPVAPVVTLRGTNVTSQGWTLNGTAFNLATPVKEQDNGAKLRYVVISACGDTMSNEVAITVNKAPTIAAITAPAAICEGNSFGATLVEPTVTANGSAITSTGWLLDGATITSSTVLTYADNGKKLKYQVAADCGTVYSNEVTITVNAKPQVATLSAPAAVCSNNALSLTAPTVTNRGVASTGSWILGNAVVTATPTVTYANNGALLKYVASSVCGNDTSNAVAITVNDKADVGTFAATAISVCENGYIATPAVAPTVTPKGSSVTKQGWTLNGNYFDFTNTQLTMADSGKSLGYMVTTDCGTTTSTSTAIITVNKAPTIAAITAPAAICEGGSLALTVPTVTANGSTITYTGWLLDNATITSSTVLTYADNGKKLKCHVAADCGNTFSNEVTITVNAKPQVATLSAPAAVCSGNALNPTEPTVTVKGAASTGSWILGNAVITPATVVTYANNGALLKYVASSTCGNDTSNAVAITVNDTAVVGTFETAGISVCEGGFIATPVKPSITLRGSAVTKEGWTLNGNDFDPTTTKLNFVDNGKVLGYNVVTECGISRSVSVATITVNQTPVIGTLATPAAVTAGEKLTVTTPTVDMRGSTEISKGWLLGGQSFNPATTTLTSADNGKTLVYFIESSCGRAESNPVNVTVRALSSDATIHSVVVNGTEYTFDNGLYNSSTTLTAGLSCDPRTETANIEVKTEAHATVASSKVTFTNGSATHTGTLDVKEPGMYIVNITVTPENGNTGEMKTYTIKLEQRFPKEAIVIKNGFLGFNANPANNGYAVVDNAGTFQWYINNEAVAGAVNQTNAFGANLISGSEYCVSALYNGERVRTCPVVGGQARVAPKFVVYPNPVQGGEAVQVEVEQSEKDLTNMIMKVYNVRGQLMSTIPATGNATTVEMPTTPGTYVINVTADGYENSAKVIVK